ncbi:putative oxidoreductase [Trifolium repens]|nr:putative oxidoreductase [Trifolium repens]
MADETKVRFGILGCAQISIKLCKALSKAPNATLIAIGSRSLEKATTFATEQVLPEAVRVYGSYEAVVEDDEIDAVYIPLPTALHVTWAVKAAERGKHVLLEKPVAMNVAELDRILEACEVNGVQFMDGTMWIHHPRTKKMKEALSDEKRFGQLKWIHSCMTYNPGPEFFKNSIRMKPDLDGLGALGDVGWYSIQAILWSVNYEVPKSVLAFPKATFNEDNVIISCGSSLHWEDGKSATFHCSFLSYVTFDVTILGTKGSLRLHDLTLPFEESFGYGTFSESSEIDYGKIEQGRWCPKPNEHVVETEFSQDVWMIKEFADLVGKIKRLEMKPEKKWSDGSRKTQLVLDAVKESIQRGYESVEIVMN